jgi:hypothetical protein
LVAVSPINVVVVVVVVVGWNGAVGVYSAVVVDGICSDRIGKYIRIIVGVIVHWHLHLHGHLVVYRLLKNVRISCVQRGLSAACVGKNVVRLRLSLDTSKNIVVVWRRRIASTANHCNRLWRNRVRAICNAQLATCVYACAALGICVREDIVVVVVGGNASVWKYYVVIHSK